MTYQLVAPDEASIRKAIAEHLPHLAQAPVESLGAGWAFWAFRAGDSVLRFTRDVEFTQTLATEAAVMRELAPTLPLPVTVIEVREGGPGGLPFTSHRHVPGVPVRELQRPLAADAGEVLGRFIRAMHDFPVARAVELGLPFETPEQRHDQRWRWFEESVVTKVFPLVSDGARASIAARFEAYLSDDGHFAYQPVVSHGDLDDLNTLADPETGEFAGVVDWSDIGISDPAGDFTVSLYGAFATKGIDVPSLARTYGMSGDALEAMRPRCAFQAFCWPLWEVLYGLDTGQEDVVEKGLAYLDETLQRTE